MFYVQFTVVHCTSCIATGIHNARDHSVNSLCVGRRLLNEYLGSDLQQLAFDATSVLPPAICSDVVVFIDVLHSIDPSQASVSGAFAARRYTVKRCKSDTAVAAVAQ